MDVRTKFKIVWHAVRPFLGDIDVKVDRRRQELTITKDGNAIVLTVEQLFDEVETIFKAAEI